MEIYLNFLFQKYQKIRYLKSGSQNDSYFPEPFFTLRYTNVEKVGNSQKLEKNKFKKLEKIRKLFEKNCKKNSKN